MSSPPARDDPKIFIARVNIPNVHKLFDNWHDLPVHRRYSSATNPCQFPGNL